MMEIGELDYTCRAFFPRSISAVHPETLMRIVLQSFVVASDAVLAEKPETEIVVDLAFQKLADGSTVSSSSSKKELLQRWVEQDLCFRTKKKNPNTNELTPHLLPYVLKVGSFKWKGQEPYDKILIELARGGRTAEGDDLNKTLKTLIRTFSDPYGDVGADLLNSSLGEIETKEFDKLEHFQDNILCKPHARLFQIDIELLPKWSIPRAQQIDLLKRLISFHMCAYLVRMSKAASWVSQSISARLMAPDAYRGETMPCSDCGQRYGSNPNEVNELALHCIFQPFFAVGGEASQEWHEVLVRYHRNVAHINLALRVAGLAHGSDATPESVFELLKRLVSDRSVRDKILENSKEDEDPARFLRSIVDERFDGERPPKGHAWDFFRRFAPSREAGFATQPRNGRMRIIPPPQLLNAWGHIFYAAREEIGRAPIFLEFLDFLRSRGFILVGRGLKEIETCLRAQGLLREYADMGVARVLESVFPAAIPIGGPDEGS